MYKCQWYNLSVNFSYNDHRSGIRNDSITDMISTENALRYLSFLQTLRTSRNWMLIGYLVSSLTLAHSAKDPSFYKKIQRSTRWHWTPSVYLVGNSTLASNLFRNGPSNENRLRCIRRTSGSLASVSALVAFRNFLHFGQCLRAIKYWVSRRKKNHHTKHLPCQAFHPWQSNPSIGIMSPNLTVCVAWMVWAMRAT